MPVEYGQSGGAIIVEVTPADSDDSDGNTVELDDSEATRFGRQLTQVADRDDSRESLLLPELKLAADLVPVADVLGENPDAEADDDGQQHLVELNVDGAKYPVDRETASTMAAYFHDNDLQQRDTEQAVGGVSG